MEQDLLDRVRQLRATGATPKVIARALGLPPAQVAPLVRAIAVEAAAGTAGGEPAPVRCWVSPGWRRGLSVAGHPEWHDPHGAAEMGEGVVDVLVARPKRGGRFSVCGYLVDVYCLGVKNAVGPRGMGEAELEAFVDVFFGAFQGEPIPAPLELAQHLVFGAVEFASGLGFRPHPDFAAARGHLGTWTGPSAITFGRDGSPFYVQGPYDNPVQILRTLGRAKHGHQVLVSA